MPSADPDLQKQMIECFGSIDAAGPTDALVAAGYKLRKNRTWAPKPGVMCYRDMTRDEFECLMFLAHEWDFGGLVLEDGSPAK